MAATARTAKQPACPENLAQNRPVTAPRRGCKAQHVRYTLRNNLLPDRPLTNILLFRIAQCAGDHRAPLSLCQATHTACAIARYLCKAPRPVLASQMPARQLCKRQMTRAAWRRPESGRACLCEHLVITAPPTNLLHQSIGAGHTFGSRQRKMLPQPSLPHLVAFKSWRRLVRHRTLRAGGAAKQRSTSVSLPWAIGAVIQVDSRLGQACRNYSRERQAAAFRQEFRHRRKSVDDNHIKIMRPRSGAQRTKRPHAHQIQRRDPGAPQ